MNLRTVLGCGLLLLAASVAWANDTDLSENLFAPDLIMQHQQALGLSEEQKAFIKTEIRNAQKLLTEAQWNLEDGVEKAAALLKAEQVDETKLIAELDRVFTLENKVKRLQMTLLIRLKNKLTPEQQTKLRALKTKAQ